MKNKNLADAFDSYVNWIVLALFLIAVNLAMEATAYLVNKSASEVLRNWAMWPSRGATVAIVVSIIWFSIKRRKSEKDRFAFFNEYTFEIIKRSSFVAFLLTFLCMGILDVVVKTTQIPADFFIKLPGFLLAATFSFSYLIFNLKSSVNK